jgi:hypothetical protein
VPGNSRVRGGPWIAAGVALACLGGAGCSGATDDQGDVASSPSVAVAVPSTPGWPPITDILKAGASALDVDDADWLQVLEDHAWTTLSTPGGGTVQQLDARSGQPQESIFNQSADICTAMDVGFDSLWAAVCHPTSASVLRIDPSSGEVQARIPLPDLQILEEGSIASGEGSVWVVTAPPRHRLVRIDPKSNKVVVARTVVLAVGGGFVWARVTDALVAKIDPASNTVVARYGPSGGSGSVAADDTAVWISAHDLDLVYRLPLG